MPWLAQSRIKLGELWGRIDFLRGGRQFDADMQEELRFHAAMKADAYRADGADALEAHHAAMRMPGEHYPWLEMARVECGIWIMREHHRAFARTHVSEGA